MKLKEIETYKDLKEALDRLPDENLKQPINVWGAGFSLMIQAIEILDEDYINPSGEGAEPISTYKDSGENYEDEDVVAKKGQVFLINLSGLNV